MYRMTKLNHLNKIDEIKSFKTKNFQKPYIYERSKIIYMFKIYKLN